MFEAAKGKMSEQNLRKHEQVLHCLHKKLILIICHTELLTVSTISNNYKFKNILFNNLAVLITISDGMYFLQKL